MEKLLIEKDLLNVKTFIVLVNSFQAYTLDPAFWELVDQVAETRFKQEIQKDTSRAIIFLKARLGACSPNGKLIDTFLTPALALVRHPKDVA